MIYPRLNKVGNGQRMSVELVNGLIKRTEYATELLRQYKTIAGDDITIEQQPDGRRISGARSQLDDLLDGRVPIGDIDGYVFDTAGIQKKYGQDAVLWVQYSLSGTPIGTPQFNVFPGSIPYDAYWGLFLSTTFPIQQNYIPPPPHVNRFGQSSTSVVFVEVSFGSSTAVQFKIGTDSFNPFL